MFLAEAKFRESPDLFEDAIKEQASVHFNYDILRLNNAVTLLIWMSVFFFRMLKS